MKQYITRDEHNINIIQTSIPTPTFAVKKWLQAMVELPRWAVQFCWVQMNTDTAHSAPIMVGAEVRNFSLKLLAAKIVGIKFIKIKVSNALNNYILYHLDSVRHREFPWEPRVIWIHQKCVRLFALCQNTAWCLAWAFATFLLQAVMTWLRLSLGYDRTVY